MEELAINGGEPVRKTPFPNPYDTIGDEEKKAVLEVMDTGVLSGFLGSWSPKFYGGEYVQRLEKEWSDYFGIKYSVSMNSATSGLIAACGAAGISPGDEVIVSPYTMTASATAPLIYGGIPVFADIDPDIFCLSPDSIRDKITKKTKAIIVVDIFGHPADMDEIMEIASENDLVVIEDAAQAAGAKYKGKYAGTLADIGVFSLNVHKIIQSGEGGVVVTDNENYAERLQLIRNHGEAVVEAKGVNNLVNLVGFNFRMGELEAAVAFEQLKKLDVFLKHRIDSANYLSGALSEIEGITSPIIKNKVRHSFYVYALKFDENIIGVNRNTFIDALSAEGISCNNGYVRPLYYQPLFQQKKAIGNYGYPFNLVEKNRLDNLYAINTSPVTENMYNKCLFLTDICNRNTNLSDMSDFINGINKIIRNIDLLK